MIGPCFFIGQIKQNNINLKLTVCGIPHHKVGSILTIGSVQLLYPYIRIGWDDYKYKTIFKGNLVKYFYCQAQFKFSTSSVQLGTEISLNPTPEGVRILWVGGGGLLKPPLRNQ